MLWIALALIAGAAVGGVAGFVGATFRFYRDSKAMALDLKHHKALAHDANEHHTQALGIIDQYQGRVEAAEASAEETAAKIQKMLTDVAKPEAAAAIKSEIVKGVDNAVALHRKAAEAAAVACREACDSARKISREISPKVKSAVAKAVESHRKEAEKAAAFAKEAADKIAKYRKDWSESLRLKDAEVREEYILRRPEPCKICEGLGFKVGKNNQRYDCKVCEDGVIERAVKGEGAISE